MKIFQTCLWLWNAVRFSIFLFKDDSELMWKSHTQKSDSAFSLMKGKKFLHCINQTNTDKPNPQTTKPDVRTKAPLTTACSPGSFKIDLYSKILFMRLPSALKVATCRFYHLKYHRFSYAICGFLVYVLLHLFEADSLAFIASVQIVPLFEYNFLLARTCALLDSLSLRY